MQRETIERLAIDRALGELNSDAEALFDAYLAEHVEARDWAQTMTQACMQTREAICQKTKPDVGPCRFSRSPWPSILMWPTVGRWAAVILISLGIGATVGRWSRPQTSTRETVVVRTESHPARDNWKRVLSQSGHSFWETKAMAILQPKSDQIPGPHRGQRSLWDRYRQSRKELSYE